MPKSIIYSDYTRRDHNLSLSLAKVKTCRNSVIKYLIQAVAQYHSDNVSKENLNLIIGIKRWKRKYFRCCHQVFRNACQNFVELENRPWKSWPVAISCFKALLISYSSPVANCVAITWWRQKMFPTSLNNNHSHKVCSFGMIRIRINAPWPLGSFCIKETKESLPEEMHPQRYKVMWSYLIELSDTGWITVQQSPISFQRQEKPGLHCTALFKTTISRKLLFTSQSLEFIIFCTIYQIIITT